MQIGPIGTSQVVSIERAHPWEADISTLQIEASIRRGHHEIEVFSSLLIG